MENFNAKEYRDNLAKDLKEIRKTDPEKAQKVLESDKQTIRYQEAKRVYDKERKILQEPYLDKIAVKNSNEKVQSLEKEKWETIKKLDEARLEYEFARVKKGLRENGETEQLQFWENIEKTGYVRLLENRLFQDLDIKPISKEEALDAIKNINSGVPDNFELRKHNDNDKIYINLSNMPYETPTEGKERVLILDIKGVYGYENLLKKMEEIGVTPLTGAELLQFVRDYYTQIESGDHRGEHIALNAIGTVWNPYPENNTNPYIQTASYHSDAGRCVATWPLQQINDHAFLVKINKKEVVPQ